MKATQHCCQVCVALFSQLKYDCVSSIYTTHRQQNLPCVYGRNLDLPMCFTVILQVGQAFADAADQYVRKFLNNGVPSLFSDLKPLYR